MIVDPTKPLVIDVDSSNGGSVNNGAGGNGIQGPVFMEIIKEDIADGIELIGKPHVGAPEGNDNAEKYKTSEERKALCMAYIEHKEKGYSDSVFPECDMKTFKNYREKYPIDFPSEQIETAERKGQFFWETIGIDGTIGKIKNYNSDSWKFNMSNRFKWKTREDMTTDDKSLNITIKREQDKE